MLLLLLLTAGVARAENLTIVQASDLHYLSPELVQDEAFFLRVMENADGKLTHYSPQIARAFVDEMIALRPDAVILSGDLTLNGAFASHEGLIAELRRLQQAGVPVLALPGNHDCTGEAYLFTSEGAQLIEGMQDEEFIAAYGEFGYQDARSRDEVSFSYVYELSPTLWAVLLDTNANYTYNTVRSETLAWLEEQLREAQQAGAQVISVTHQNLLIHHRHFTFGYQINNASAVLRLYAQYGVRLNLGGHLHLQHIAEKDGFTDIATSALSVHPNQYAVLTWDGASLRYATRPLDVAAWAIANGIEDPHLLDFAAYSQAFFDNNTRIKQLMNVTTAPVGAEIRQQMLDYAIELNRRIFAGTVAECENNEALALWQQYLPNAFFTPYMQTVVEENTRDMNRFELRLAE